MSILCQVYNLIWKNWLTLMYTNVTQRNHSCMQNPLFWQMGWQRTFHVSRDLSCDYLKKCLSRRIHLRNVRHYDIYLMILTFNKKLLVWTSKGSQETTEYCVLKQWMISKNWNHKNSFFFFADLTLLYDRKRNIRFTYMWIIPMLDRKSRPLLIYLEIIKCLKLLNLLLIPSPMLSRVRSSNETK